MGIVCFFVYDVLLGGVVGVVIVCGFVVLYGLYCIFFYVVDV